MVRGGRRFESVRGLAKSPLTGIFRSRRLALRRTCGGYGAAYGAFAFRNAARGIWPGDTELSSRPMRSSTCDSKASLLAPLTVGDRLPWKLDHEDEPQWLVVVDVLSPTSYVVRYPDDSLGALVDFRVKQASRF